MAIAVANQDLELVGVGAGGGGVVLPARPAFLSFLFCPIYGRLRGGGGGGAGPPRLSSRYATVQYNCISGPSFY